MSNNKLLELAESATLLDVSCTRSYDIECPPEYPDSATHAPDKECAGKHFIIDLWGASHLDNIEKLEHALKHAAVSAGAVLLHIHLHKFSSGGGVTGVALLAESHISVHTWPERGYAAFDVFMCGAAQPEKAVEVLESMFNPSRVDVKRINRGEHGACSVA